MEILAVISLFISIWFGQIITVRVMYKQTIDGLHGAIFAAALTTFIYVMWIAK